MANHSKKGRKYAGEGNKEIWISDEVLRTYGCRNCVWKGSPSCPMKFTKQYETTDEGFCEDFAVFFSSFFSEGDSISAVKEKFNLYVQEMQAASDRTVFLSKEEELKKLITEGKDDGVIARARLEIELYRVWWQNLSTNVVKGLSRIVDREKRSEDVKNSSPSKISVQQLNVLLKGNVVDSLPKENPVIPALIENSDVSENEGSDVVDVSGENGEVKNN